MKTLLTIVFIAVCIALFALVMRQESKSDGLSSTMSGMGESYRGKNKGRSIEGKLVTWTAILGVAFLVLTVILNMAW